MARGRKPTPTVLKILRGNPGKRALNGAEPVFESGLPQCPKTLSAAAKKEWAYYAKQLQYAGLATKADRAALGALAAAVADYFSLRRLVDAVPPLTTGEDGKPAVSKAHARLRSMLREAEISLRSWASEFGLTPAVRSRMRVPGSAPAADPFEDFLGAKSSS